MLNSDLWIRHALNQGEYHIPGTRYHCDGYCPETNTVHEFLGCHWHGSRTCYPRDRHTITIPGTDKTAVELFTLTKIRDKAIRESTETAKRKLRLYVRKLQKLGVPSLFRILTISMVHDLGIPISLPDLCNARYEPTIFPGAV